VNTANNKEVLAMSDERDQAAGRRDDEFPSVEQVAGLDAFLDGLVDDRRPAPHELTAQETGERMLAAQLRLAQEGVETPTPTYLDTLERTVARAMAEHSAAETRPQRHPHFSRGGFLRAAATLASGAGLGVAGVESVALVQEGQRPHDLVVAGNERWYNIAATGEVPPGGIKSFSAGGVLGFLLNTGGDLHAVSAICTHMGCRLKPDAPAQGPTAGLHCLCHGSRFDRQGAVLQGLAPSPLPPIALRVENGRVYAHGTAEDI